MVKAFFLRISWDLIIKLTFEKKVYKLILMILINYTIWGFYAYYTYIDRVRLNHQTLNSGNQIGWRQNTRPRLDPYPHHN